MISRKKVAVNAAKLVVSSAAVWYVIHKIDTARLIEALKGVSYPLLLLALLLFVASKAVSALRLNIYFRNIGVLITESDNIRLYLLGMFYNLFLPGGIGGDGYKVWLLNRQSGAGVKRLLSAVLLDRANGMFAIVLLAFIMMMVMPAFGVARWYAPLAFAFSLAGYWLMVRWWFSLFLRSIAVTTLLSVAVQLLQVMAVIAIAVGIGVKGGYPELIMIFMVSSAVAVLPFTIGGVGARELVFLYGSVWWHLDASQAVAISMLFFIIAAAVSLTGIYFQLVHISIVKPKPENHDKDVADA